MRYGFNKIIMLKFIFYFPSIFASNQALHEPLIFDDTDNNTAPYNHIEAFEIPSFDLDIKTRLKQAEDKIKLIEKEYSKVLLKNCELEHRLEVCIHSLNFFMKEYQCVSREKFALSCAVSILTHPPL